MSRRSYGLVGGLLCVSLGLAWQAQSQQGPESVYAELEKAPPKFQQMQNPLAKDPDAAVAGGILFEEHCESCHGKEAVGG